MRARLDDVVAYSVAINFDHPISDGFSDVEDGNWARNLDASRERCN